MTTFRDINSGIALITLYFVALWPCHKRGVSRMLVESVYQEQDCVCIYNQAMSKPSGFTLMLPCLWLAKQIDHVSRSAYLKIRQISSVRHLLPRKATLQLMCSFVLSRLDYCNSLLIDITSDQIYRLQKKKIKIMQPKSVWQKET